MPSFLDIVLTSVNTGFFVVIGGATIAVAVMWCVTIFKDRQNKSNLIQYLVGKDEWAPEFDSLVVRTGADGSRILRRWPGQVAEKILQYEWMPAFVTSVGVLGTFLGISIGLLEMDLVDPSESGSSKSLMQSITQLLDGMKTAFFTSVAGIFAGLVLSFLRHQLFLPVLSRQHQKTVLDLQRNGIRVFESSDLLEGNGSQDMVEAATAMAQSAKSFNADAIADKMTSSLSPILERISQELSALSEIKKDNGQEVLQNMMSDLRTQVIEPIQQRLESTAQLVEGSTDSVKQLTQTIAPLGEELNNTVDKLQMHQQESIDSIERVLKRFQEDVGDKLTEQLTSAGQVLSETLDKLNNDLGVHLETLNSLASQVPSLDAELVASIESVLNKVVASSRQLLQQLKEGAEAQQRQLSELHTEVVNYHGGSREFLDEYIKTVNTASTQVHEKLLDVARILASASAVTSHVSNRKEEPLSEPV